MAKVSMELEAEDLRMLLGRTSTNDLQNVELLAAIVVRGPSVCGFIVKSLISELTPDTFERIKNDIDKYRAMKA